MRTPEGTLLTVSRATNHLMTRSPTPPHRPGPTLVYIAGTVRSGSTILGKLLGENPGVVHCGEIKQIWRCLKNGYLCECGEPFAACPFWSDVLTRAFGSVEALDLEMLLAAQQRVERGPFGGKAADGDRPAAANRRYHEAVRGLYAAIAEVSGAEVIVDGSKAPRHGYLLRNLLDMPIVPIHLVRDSRAVAFSTQRRRVDPAKNGELMPRHGPVRAGVAWDRTHLLLGLHPIAPGQIVLRYEDFAADPNRAMTDIGHALGGRDLRRDWPVGEALPLPRRHTVAGNPVRFAPTVTLAADDEWRERLPIAERALVTLLTLPLLARFGYLARRGDPVSSRVPPKI
jgi:hypothetical protein